MSDKSPNITVVPAEPGWKIRAEGHLYSVVAWGVHFDPKICVNHPLIFPLTPNHDVTLAYFGDSADLLNPQGEYEETVGVVPAGSPYNQAELGVYDDA